MSWAMTYGLRLFKNNKRRGYLEFSTGKVLVLNDTEVQEFEQKCDYWMQGAVDKYIDKAPARCKRCACEGQLKIKRGIDA